MIARNLFDLYGWRSPFSELERMRSDMERLAGRFGRNNLGVFPTINLSEDNDNFYIRAELPGIDSENLDIQAAGDSLSISGERKIEVEEGVKYHRREREAGKFSRMIKFPKPCDTEKIDASLVNGILNLTIPKSEAAKPRQITVK